MPRTCTICSHDRRLEIEKALVRRESYRAISRQFGVGRDALRRHVKEHLADRLKKAHGEEDVRGALDLVKQLRDINDTAFAILGEARGSRKPETALRAIDRIYRQLALQLQITERQDLEERLEALEIELKKRRGR